jgi:predicted RNase H-like HicB family nuclease
VSRYPVDVFWSDEDRAYVADVPDLAACSAFGETPEEALREARAAQALWLESARAHGDPIPEPTLRPESARAAG